jgi:cytochrome c oxidase assembly factor CtaG
MAGHLSRRLFVELFRMTGWELFLETWDFKPSVVAGCLLLAFGYLAAVRFRYDKHTAFFMTGIAVMFISLVSPMDELGDEYLFSAHMLQHILLDLVSPPLFVLGLPADLVRRWMQRPLIAKTERILGNPVFALFMGNLTLYYWHLPDPYNATLVNEAVHILEHLTFLVTGTMMWWPIFAPLESLRLEPLKACIYLVIAGLANGILGIILTVASTPFYSGYTNPHDELGALSLIRDTWGLDQVNDQKLGGALMWVIGSLVFIWALMAVIARWYREAESDSSNDVFDHGGVAT